MPGQRKMICQGDVPIGYFDGDTAVVDSEFLRCAVVRELIVSGHPMRWDVGIAAQLEQRKSHQPQLRPVRVYQLRSGIPDKKFIGYDELCRRFGGISPQDYVVVYDGQLETDEPDILYELLNGGRESLPRGYIGHRLTVSDVVERCGEQGPELWYLDISGFVQLDVLGAWKERMPKKKSEGDGCADEKKKNGLEGRVNCVNAVECSIDDDASRDGGGFGNDR